MKQFLSSILFCWLVLIPAAWADAVSDLPDTWADRLESIQPQDLDNLDEVDRNAMLDTRNKLSGLLLNESQDIEKLSVGYGRLGAFYQVMRLYTAAELAYNNATSLDPKDYKWPYYLADIALALGDSKKAIRQLERSLELKPDYQPTRLRLAQALSSVNRNKEASELYNQLVDLPEFKAAAHYGLGKLASRERRYKDAIRHYQGVLELAPEANAVHYPLAQAMIVDGQRQAAKAYLAKPGDQQPTWPDPLMIEIEKLKQGALSYFQKGLKAVNDSDVKTAIESFGAGLERMPENSKARVSYARVLWLDGQHEAGEKQLQRAYKDDANNDLAVFLLAVIADTRGDAIAAKQGYEQTLAIVPDHEGANAYLANLLLREGNFSTAADRFGKSMAAGTRYPMVLMSYWFAKKFSGTGDKELADLLVTYDKEHPEPPFFKLMLIRLRATSEDPDVRDLDYALTEARTLVKMQPMPPHQELLALALAASGKFEEAVKIQEELNQMARQYGMDMTQLDETLTAYQQGKLPQAWSKDSAKQLSQPPNADQLMNNYPAPQPY